MAVLQVKLRLPPKKIEAILSELKERGLLDQIEGTLRPHNWDGRQFKSDVVDPTNAERQQRYRDRHRVTEKTVTNSVTDKLPETETEKKDAANAATDPEKELFDRGKVVAGKDAGGLIAKLLKTKKGNIPLARAAVEMASTKQDPREYLAGICRGGHASEDGKRLTNDEAYWGKGRIPGIV
jgi:hypothetical protein